MRWFVVALVATLIVVVTWWRLPASTSNPSAGLPQQSSDDGAMTVAAIDAQPGPRRLSQPLPLNDADQRAQQLAERARERDDVNRVVEAGRNKLVGRYESERVDQGWASSKQVELAELSTSAQIEAINVQPGNLAVDCRSTVCRIGADFATRSAADDWAALYLTNVGSRLPNASLLASRNPDGSTHLEVYGLARP